MTDTSKLRSWSQALRALPSLSALSVREVAAAIEPEIRATINAGQAPDGAAWPLTDAGTEPLQRAGESVTVEVSGNVVVTEVRARHALHHLDRNGAPVARQVIPRGLTPRLIDAATKAVSDRFATEVTRGR